MHVALNTPTADCLTCCCLLLSHLPQSGYIGRQCKLPFIREISAVIASLKSMTLLLTTCLISSLFQQVIDFYIDLLIQPGTKRVTSCCRVHLKRDGTRAETRFCLSPKRTSPFKSAGASVQSTTGGRGACVSGSNAGYTMFRGSVKSTGYPLHLPVSPSLPLLVSPCAIMFQTRSTTAATEH